MPTSVVISSGSAVQNDGTTGYFPLVGSPRSISTEAGAETPIRSGCYLKNLFVNVSTNTHTTANSVITLRKSTADTSITITYTAAQTGIKEDATNVVSYANTDEACYCVVTDANTGTTAITFSVLSINVMNDSTAESIDVLGLVMPSGSTFSTDSTTIYQCLQGGIANATTTEANQLFTAKGSYTFSNLYSYVTTNTRTTDVVVRSRKNSANGSQSFTYTSGQTGVKEDTSNTDSLVSGNTLDISITNSTGGGSFTPTVVTIQGKNLNNCSITTRGSGSSTMSFNETKYFSFCGSTVNSTESNTFIYFRNRVFLKNFYTYCTLNTITTSPSTITVRKNSTDTDTTVSYNAAQTGQKSLLTTSVFLDKTDTVNYKLVTPNTSGFFYTSYIQLSIYEVLTVQPGGVAASGAAGFQF